MQVCDVLWLRRLESGAVLYFSAGKTGVCDVFWLCLLKLRCLSASQVRNEDVMGFGSVVFGRRDDP
jgi:hypothetical protein